MCFLGRCLIDAQVVMILFCLGRKPSSKFYCWQQLATRHIFMICMFNIAARALRLCIMDGMTSMIDHSLIPRHFLLLKGPGYEAMLTHSLSASFWGLV